MYNILDIKLIPKQQIILNALESAENTHKRVEDIITKRSAWKKIK